MSCPRNSITSSELAEGQVIEVMAQAQEKNHRQLEQRGEKTYVARLSAVFLMLDHEKVVEPMCR